MSRIGLTSGFQIVPEGKHIFRIESVTYDEHFGVLRIRMRTKDGTVHTEQFKLLTKDNEPNDKALNAFSYFAKTATRNYANREIDTEELVGCYIGATAEHNTQPNRNNPEKTVTFVNLSDYTEATAFEGEDAPAPSGSDLLASLGL